MTTEPLGQGLTEAQLSLRPFCYVCNWRKGGLDSWNGHACKCGHQAPTFRELFNAARSADGGMERNAAGECSACASLAFCECEHA